MNAAFRWLFENRRTGRITIGQWPNLPLWIFLVAAGVRAVTEGDVSDGANLIATIALVVWAGAEVIRGVNPFRRVLGVVVLLGVVV